MRNAARPYPLRTVIGAGLALAVGFLALSLFFLFLQARNAEIHLSGEIVAISGASITIRNAHGVETDLLVTPDTKLGRIEEISALVPGQHIMTDGEFNDSEVFEAEGIRLVRRPRLK